MLIIRNIEWFKRPFLSFHVRRISKEKTDVEIAIQNENIIIISLIWKVFKYDTNDEAGLSDSTGLYT